MRYSIPLLAFAFAAIASAQVVLDPSPARIVGHPSASEQIVVSNLNPDFGSVGGLDQPQGIAVDTSSSPPHLYVADTANNRVLGWKNATSALLNNGQAPDLVVGQPNFYTTIAGTNAILLASNTWGGLNGPTGLAVDPQGNLYVADAGNNRVLRYPTPFANSSGQPDIVLGQPDMFKSRSANQGGKVAANTLSLSSAHGNVASMIVDGPGNLYVCDVGNDRVLQFAASTLVSGAIDPKAALVIGQVGFTAVIGPTGATDLNTLYTPAGVAIDSNGNLFITDSYYSRLMVYTPPFSNGMAASRIAGIVTPAPATATASTLLGPQGVVIVNNGPAVVDTDNSRYPL